MTETGHPKPVGRPTDFRPEFVQEAKALAEQGAVDIEIAQHFEIHTSTLYRWMNAHPEFRDAIKTAKCPADDRVERSLYQKALGYSHEAVKIMVVDGEVREIPYIEHHPPDTAAAFIWLKNRRPELWRDKHEVKHTGNLEISTESDADFARKVAFLLAKGQAEAEMQAIRAAAEDVEIVGETITEGEK